jgi:acyl carrier protein
MPAAEIEEIVQLVSMQLGTRNVAPQHRLLEDLGAESADVANLVARVEEKYQIVLTETEIARIRTCEDLFELVNTKLSDNPTGG